MTRHHGMMTARTDCAEEVPWSECVTDYDEQHFAVYIQLLDAHAAGATAGEMARRILRLDPAQEPQRAYKALASHLHRARWIVGAGHWR